MAGDAEAFQKYVQKAMDALEKEMVENIYGSGSLFWRWNQETRPTDPPPRYGPTVWQASWRFADDLDVEIVDADHRRFTTPGWESESVTLDRAQAMELLEMLERWLRP